jgi:hypothetical protein
VADGNVERVRPGVLSRRGASYIFSNPKCKAHTDPRLNLFSEQGGSAL